MKLRSTIIINDPNRVSSVDIFRALAVLWVVLYHFNETIPHGYLGVDLFFVISGLLVGGILTRELNSGKQIHFGKFILRRGFKIWPSFYFFMLVGSVLAFVLYHESHPEQVIPLWDMKRYLFFYQNIVSGRAHWSFDHVWSLCVEEHFYVLLPLLYFIVQRFVKAENRVKCLFALTILIIAGGITSKHLCYFFTNSKDTWAGTYNCMDVLAWGVLLNLLLNYRAHWLKNIAWMRLSFIAGVFLFAACLLIMIQFDFVLFEEIYIHTLIPVSYFLMLMGAYHWKMHMLKPLRYVAYYSYNWFLWHPLFVIAINKITGNTFTGLIIYLLFTFVIAFIATIAIEEPLLKKRENILKGV